MNPNFSTPAEGHRNEVGAMFFEASQPKQDAAGFVSGNGSSPIAAGVVLSHHREVPCNVAAVVEKFNEAFCYAAGDMKILMPVDRETIQTLATLAGLRGRADIATELEACL